MAQCQNHHDLNASLLSSTNHHSTDSQVETTTMEEHTVVTSHSSSSLDGCLNHNSSVGGNDAELVVPVEVNVDNDNDSSCEESVASSSYDSSSEEEEADDDDDDIVDLDDNDSDHNGMEEDSESENSDDDDDRSTASNSCSSPSSHNSPRVHHTHTDHELFLPHDTSPSFTPLKFESDDDDSSSSDEEEDGEDECSPMMHHRTYMMENARGYRPRMMLLPQSGNCKSRSLSSFERIPSNVSDSSSTEEDSSVDSHKSKDKNGSTPSTAANTTSRPGVSFNTTVAVYPVFETDAYPPSMISSMFTKRDELRINKLRNKREFAYDRHDWRTATEEEEMEAGEDGELVHPVHTMERRETTVTMGGGSGMHRPFLSSSPSSWQVNGGSVSSVVHRAKRMRMYYP
jgi:hypothetical protein